MTVHLAIASEAENEPRYYTSLSGPKWSTLGEDAGSKTINGIKGLSTCFELISNLLGHRRYGIRHIQL